MLANRLGVRERLSDVEALAAIDTLTNTIRKAKAEILLITLSDVQSKTMVDTLAHTVPEPNWAV